MKPVRENFKRVLSAVRTAMRTGSRPAFESVQRKLRDKRDYRKWLEKFGTLDDGLRRQYRSRIAEMARVPLISVLLPVYDIDETWLRACIESTIRQIYVNWELCIADDCSTNPHVRQVLEEYQAADERIRVVFREANGHISAASNSALELAAGEFTVLLDHDDELSEDALFWVANELNDHPDAMLIYSDEDLIDEKGRRSAPKFKPDWSRDLFYSVNIITHLSAYRTSLLKELGGFRTGFEGSQDYDLGLRAIEKIEETAIRHIPRVLYHWRAIRGSVAYGGGEKPYAHERAREALRSHFDRTGKDVTVTETVNDLHRVQYKLPGPAPKVTLIFTAEDAEFGIKLAGECERLTKYPNMEIVVAAKNKSHGRSPINLKLAACASRSAALNSAAAQSGGDILCFVDAGLLPSVDDWLAELASFAAQDEIGAVGAKVLAKNKTVAGTGLIIGAGQAAAIAHFGFPGNSAGNMARNILNGNYSAVSVSCMAVRRKVFEDAGGFDAENLPNELFDADLCLRLAEMGKRIAFTPYAEMIRIKNERQEKITAAAAEIEYFRNKWNGAIESDPFYNPNLSKRDAGFSIDI